MMIIFLGSGLGHQVAGALEAKTERRTFLGRRQTRDGGHCYFIMYLSSQVTFREFVLCHQRVG